VCFDQKDYKKKILEVISMIHNYTALCLYMLLSRKSSVT